MPKQTGHWQKFANADWKTCRQRNTAMGMTRCLIAEEMQKNGWCPAGQMPQSVIAWDLVRLVNLGRWAYLCDYIREDEMWHIMQVAADTALEHFSSWEEYGRSFIMGRGVWHGDPTDSETAYEIVELLLKNSESPWKQSMWKE